MCQQTPSVFVRWPFVRLSERQVDWARGSRSYSLKATTWNRSRNTTPRQLGPQWGCFFRIRSFCVAKYCLRANKMRNLGRFGRTGEEHVEPGSEAAAGNAVEPRWGRGSNARFSFEVDLSVVLRFFLSFLSVRISRSGWTGLEEARLMESTLGEFQPGGPATVFTGRQESGKRCKEGERERERETLQLLLLLLPSVAIYPSLNGVCLPDLPRMKCHILDWSLSLNRFLCLPWFPRPSPTSLLGHGPLMCQPRLGTLGVGYVWCVCVCACVCVCVCVS